MNWQMNTEANDHMTDRWIQRPMITWPTAAPCRHQEEERKAVEASTSWMFFVLAFIKSISPVSLPMLSMIASPLCTHDTLTHTHVGTHTCTYAHTDMAVVQWQWVFVCYDGCLVSCGRVVANEGNLETTGWNIHSLTMSLSLSSSLSFSLSVSLPLYCLQGLLSPRLWMSLRHIHHEPPSPSVCKNSPVWIPYYVCVFVCMCVCVWPTLFATQRL